MQALAFHWRESSDGHGLSYAKPTGILSNPISFSCHGWCSLSFFNSMEIFFKSNGLQRDRHIPTTSSPFACDGTASITKVTHPAVLTVHFVDRLRYECFTSSTEDTSTCFSCSSDAVFAILSKAAFNIAGNTLPLFSARRRMP